MLKSLSLEKKKKSPALYHSKQTLHKDLQEPFSKEVPACGLFGCQLVGSSCLNSAVTPSRERERRDHCLNVLKKPTSQGWHRAGASCWLYV